MALNPMTGVLVRRGDADTEEKPRSDGGGGSSKAAASLESPGTSQGRRDGEDTVRGGPGAGMAPEYPTRGPAVLCAQDLPAPAPRGVRSEGRAVQAGPPARGLRQPFPGRSAGGSAGLPPPCSACNTGTSRRLWEQLGPVPPSSALR
ncbi:unnamed protein product [Rangifer tarandus platyrhynchus]|uniref:Uncharacterized protein n=1 Tax=Rangifer tarandus platyrhynchus TaxID=3082113 RepID=A0AC59ZVN9_RANTA